VGLDGEKVRTLAGHTKWFGDHQVASCDGRRADEFKENLEACAATDLPHVGEPLYDVRVLA